MVENAEGRETPYDFFIMHAWKDKEDFVNGLVETAKKAGLDVWDDQSAITWGDSIRQKIDDGLRRSFFGVVVLSPNFLSGPGRSMSWTASFSVTSREQDDFYPFGTASLRMMLQRELLR